MVKPDHSDHLSTIDGDIFVNSFDGLFFGGGVGCSPLPSQSLEQNVYA